MQLARVVIAELGDKTGREKFAWLIHSMGDKISLELRHFNRQSSARWFLHFPTFIAALHLVFSLLNSQTCSLNDLPARILSLESGRPNPN